MSEKQSLNILEIVFGLIGYFVLYKVGWEIALGVFFIHWAINARIERNK